MQQILITTNSLEEAQVALEALESFRARGQAIKKRNATLMFLADYLEAALSKAPMNAVKAAVLQALVATPPGVWMPYPEVVEAVVADGAAAKDAPGRTQAALRDLSWQVREAVPSSLLAGLQKPIEALADRARSTGVFQYRLTAAGRQAVQRYFA